MADDYYDHQKDMAELIFEGRSPLDPMPWAHLDGETRSDTRDTVHPNSMFFSPREGYSQNREDYP